MRHLIPARENDEIQTEVTPSEAGWTFLEFAVHALAAGRAWRRASEDRELCLVFQAGDATVALEGPEAREWTFEGRRNVFSGMAHAVYVPPGYRVRIEPATDVVVALGSAPAEGRLPPRLIRPDDVDVEIRGGHNVTRQISHILDPGDAEHLLCVEVYTPSGNWSSYPPHRHDVQDPPDEVDLEEIYQYRIDPPDGWMLQRLFNDDRTLDERLLVHDGDTVLVREGYHPVVAAPGYDGYYLNFLAGETPSWAVHDEPQLAWVRDAWEGREGRLRLPLRGTGTRPGGET